MGEIRNYIWIFPLVGGFLALGAFFSPAAYITESGDYFYVWIWALYSYQIYDPFYHTFYRGIEFIQNPDFLIPSIVCSIIIFLCILTLIGSSFIYRKRIREGKINPIVWLVASICIIGSTIAWMIVQETEIPSGDPSFWSYMNPGFGVIGMFIGSILPIIGYGGARVSTKQKRETIQPLQKRVAVTEAHDPITSTTKIKFCPECGNRLSKENQKFCMDCGTDIIQKL